MTARRLIEGWGAAVDDTGRPFYARALRLQHIKLSSTVCFVFLEGATALAIILALAELIPLWGIVLLPVCVAAMVKINDLVAGAAVRAAAHRPDGGRRPMRPMRPFRTIGRATVPGGAGTEKVGRVYRSTTPEPAPNPEAPPTIPAPTSFTSDDWSTEAAEAVGTSPVRTARGAAIPMARHANPATPGNPPDAEHGKAARTASTPDLFDTPAQRARHAATRRYE